MILSEKQTTTGLPKIEKALQAARETKALVIGEDVLCQVAELFKEQFPDKVAVVVSDAYTCHIAGHKVVEYLNAGGVQQIEPYVFNDKDLYAEYSFVDALADYLKSHDAIPVAVGAGTINDLVKLASHIAYRPYMCVATAASMDGYTAFGASITANGAKQTFDCPAPRVCLADINIIAAAPPEMNASGYADLFAKITAGADWILADSLKVEAIDNKAWSIVQDGLSESLSDPEGIPSGDHKAVTELIQGLMLGGFAMQSYKSSRPASGAEHQFSHLWNMEHHTNNGEGVSHGFQVAIGVLAVTAFYERMLATRLEDLDVEACCEKWPDINSYEIQAVEMFKNTDFPDVGVTEIKAKYISKEELANQLCLLKNNWSEIKSRLISQLIPYDKVKDSFRKAGVPYEPEQIGISREYLRETFIRAQYIRRRFTILDVAVRTCCMDMWLNELFGKGGIWEI
jgi:glycerol-1-phosphate dehydrogenase [NAD(P)+]